MTPREPSPPNEKRASRTVVLALGIVTLFAALAIGGYLWFQNTALATLVDVTGPTERDTAKTLKQWRAAARGDTFQAGDGARTSAQAVAHFRLHNGALLKVNPASQIRFQRPGGEASVKVDVDLGEVDVESGAGRITIESEFGPIVLDANSAITMTRDGSRLNVSVELGSIQLSDRAVSAGSGLELELGGLVIDVPVPSATAELTPSAQPTASAEPTPELVVGDGVSAADLVVAPGESFVVHDPSPPTAVGFRLSAVCTGPARLSAGAQATEAVGQAALRFAKGAHGYEVRCLDNPDVVVARGTVRVLEDAGTQKLPTFAPVANVVTDGRSYTVLFQNRLPKVTVSWPTAPQAPSYTLTVGSRTIKTEFPYHTFAQLARGRHQVVFSAETTPVRQSRTTTIDVVYDTQAPAARVSESNAGEGVKITGQALPGWEVSVGDKPLAVDGKQNFSVDVTEDATVPITFTHPGKDTHYYLRRPKAAP